MLSFLYLVEILSKYEFYWLKSIFSNRYRGRSKCDPYCLKLKMKKKNWAVGLHCKYIRRNYDGTLAIHRSSTTIPCRFQLQCSIWKVLIWNSKISSKVIVGSQFRYTWSITILDCNVYNESNLTSYYQSTGDSGI